jgi:hypothetical protein
MQTKLLGIISEDFEEEDQLLITYCAFLKYFREMGIKFVHFKKAYDSVRREFLYNILTECGIPMKLVRLIIMCLNETYSTVRLGKNLSDMFPTRNGLKQGDALRLFLFNFALDYAITKGPSIPR